MRKRRFPFRALGVLLIACFVIAGVMFGRSPESQSSTARTGTPVVKNLGVQPSAYGSKWEAQELVSLISQNTNAPRVTITATDPTGARVEMTADFNADQLTRTHGASTENWQGHVIGRLMNAAQGGSLNSTS